MPEPQKGQKIVNAYGRQFQFPADATEEEMLAEVDKHKPENQIYGFMAGAGQQVLNIPKGLATLGVALSPAGSPQQRTAVAESLWEGLQEPWRQLGGRPSPAATLKGTRPRATQVEEARTGADSMPGRLYRGASALLGGAPGQASVERQRGQTGRALASELTLPLLNLFGAGLVGKLLPKKLPPALTRYNLQMRTLGDLGLPKGADPLKVIENATGVMDEAIARGAAKPPTGKPPTGGQITLGPALDQYQQLVDSSLAMRRADYNALATPHYNKPVWASEIADALRQRADELASTANTSMNEILGNIMTPDGLRWSALPPNIDRAVAKDAYYLFKQAQQYDTQPWTLGSLEGLRRRVYEIEKGAPAAQRQAERSNAQVMEDNILKQKTRELVYRKVAEFSGAPEEYIHSIQRDVHDLLSVKDALAQRKALLTSTEMERAGRTLPERLRKNVSAYMHPTGRSGATVHPPFASSTPSPEAAGARAVKAFKPAVRFKGGKQAATALGLGRIGQIQEEEEPPTLAAPVKRKK